MDKIKTIIWGRSFELDIVFDVYKGEEILPKQKEALRCFTSTDMFTDESLDAVKKYCLSRDSDEIEDKIENIFKYVVPQSIYIPRRQGEYRIVALMCAYRFDIEHGIAVIFSNEQLKNISNQDNVI